MAPLPPESTRRYYFDYICDTIPHTVQMRTTETASDIGAFGEFQALTNIIAPLFSLCSLTGIRRSDIGSNISYGVLPGSVWTFGTGGQTDVNRPAFLSFIGRSPSSGRRVRVFFYGLVGVTQDDYRLTGVESTEVQDAVNYLNTIGGYWISISGGFAVWKAYANQGFNAYWQRKARG